VETLDDDTPEQLVAKRHAWQEADAAARRSTFARLADSYVAAFLTPKLGATGDAVPLSGYLWSVLTGQPANAEVEDAAHALCRQHGVFHWWLAFPQVAAKGGFSVMLGNPPWEMLQLDPQEFFAAEAPSIANAQHMAAREKLIAALQAERPYLYRKYWAAVRAMEAVQAFVHASGRYPNSGFGRINLASLFAETCLQAARLEHRGRVGMVLPSGIATDSFTQHLFNAIASGNLVSLLDFENRDGIFPGVHRSYKFCLLTMGRSQEAKFQFFSANVSDLADARRQFALSPNDFGLLNPNTRTCPVFRSQADAELTKKLYRATPVLWKEPLTDADGAVTQAEHNPWGLQFQLMFMMNTDSGLFVDAPASPGQSRRLPLYEAKMIHQFDHRWATYVDAAAGGEVETNDVGAAQKVDPDFVVRPRYWVDEREVLARIARVPSRVAKGWLALHVAATQAQTDAALAELLLALAAWVAGELFARAVGTPVEPDGWPQSQALPHIAPTEAQLKACFPKLNEALLESGLTTKKALADFPKWAAQNLEVRLSDAELASLIQALAAAPFAPVLRGLLDEWMDRRSPRWLMGWRDITNATNERTVIASIIPRAGVGNNLPLMFFADGPSPPKLAALLGNLCSLTFDFVARHKVGGIHLNFFLYKQLPVLSPDRYTADALDFIVPRVLELTYTAHDLRPWAEDLGHRGPPFAWDPERRAVLRTELDTYYAHLYGLTLDELRYILDPKDVMGDDYPSETFRVLKEGEQRTYGEYRTRRLVLEAWGRLELASSLPAGAAVFSDQGVIRDHAEADLAGLVAAVIARSANGLSVTDVQRIFARATNAEQAALLLPSPDAARLGHLAATFDALQSSTAGQRIPSFIYRLEAGGAVHAMRRDSLVMYLRKAAPLPPDVTSRPEHDELAALLLALDKKALEARRELPSPDVQSARNRGTA
jgi:hypothetical protein